MVLATTLVVEVDSILSAAESAQQHDLQTALSGLESLQSMTVTTQLLSESQVGKKIRKLTKHDNHDISEAAKTLVAKWKECVREEQEGPSKRPSDCRFISCIACEQGAGSADSATATAALSLATCCSTR